MPQRVLATENWSEPIEKRQTRALACSAASATSRLDRCLGGAVRRRAVVVLWALKHFTARTHPHQPRWHDTDVLAPYEPSVTVAVLAFGSSRPFSIGTRSVNWAKIAGGFSPKIASYRPTLSRKVVRATMARPIRATSRPFMTNSCASRNGGFVITQS